MNYRLCNQEKDSKGNVVFVYKTVRKIAIYFYVIRVTSYTDHISISFYPKPYKSSKDKYRIRADKLNYKEVLSILNTCHEIIENEKEFKGKNIFFKASPDLEKNLERKRFKLSEEYNQRFDVYLSYCQKKYDIINSQNYLFSEKDNVLGILKKESNQGNIQRFKSFFNKFCTEEREEN